MTRWLLLPALAVSFSLHASALRLEAETAKLSARSRIVLLANDIKAVSRTETEPDKTFSADLRFEFDLPQSGAFYLWSRAAIDAEGAATMAKTRNPFGGPKAQLRINGGRIGLRDVFLPWSKPEGCLLNLQRISLPAGGNKIEVLLPPHVQLDYLELRSADDPALPEKVRNYQPPILPPASHPRLWLNGGDLERIRKNLDHPDHRAVWEKLALAAQKPFAWHPDPVREVPFRFDLCTAARAKAFYSLMTGDEKIAEEAVTLMRDYLEAVNCGNRHDVCRDVGIVLHSAACVYDWCYAAMSDADRTAFRRALERLRCEMECGWPPFRQNIVNGHGNEMQISRDLLSMAVAVYDEDPEPYRICAYRVLEELVPMRDAEYTASPRHDQGIHYGFYRHACDLSAALLFKAMSGRKIFAPNFDKLYHCWLFLRRPDWGMLTDGDANMTLQFKKYRAPDTAFLAAAYSADAKIKADFLRMRGKKLPDDVLYLILDDPLLQPEPSLEALPTARDFGKMYGSLLFRTGWTMGPESDDAVVEVRGGGYHFGNHRHSDAGSFQIFYRTVLAGPLGLYRFYGTDYDYGFNKRSVSRSMLLCYDPEELFFEKRCGNDGGSRFVRQVPETVAEITEKPEFFYGTRLACTFGPDPHRPFFACFAAQLAGAYSKKIPSFVRRFVFHRSDDQNHPLLLIVADEVESAKPEFRKYWQLTTLEKITREDDSVRVSGKDAQGRVGNLYCRMLLPAKRTLDVACGEESHNVFGRQFMPASGVAPRGSRIIFSPGIPAKRDSFLAVLQVTPDEVRPLETRLTEQNGMRIVEIGDTVTAIPAQKEEREEPFTLSVTGKKKILAVGLKAGRWRVTTPAGHRDFEVLPEQNTVYLECDSACQLRFVQTSMLGAGNFTESTGR